MLFISTKHQAYSPLLLLAIVLFSFDSQNIFVSSRSSGDIDDDSLTPNYWGCTTKVAQSFRYCHMNLTPENRVEALLDELSLSEKISLLSPDPTLPEDTYCYTHTPGIARIGLPSFLWLVETNTAVASACRGNTCATTFAGPIAMAATWNRTAWREKGRVLGTEQRAMMNVHHSRKEPGLGTTLGIGLTSFGPNINLQRDPRFGRSSELPGGEDPFLVGQYAAEMVQGLQTLDRQQRFPLALAYLKHYAVYNRETDRGSDNYNVSLFDLMDSYLPAFFHAVPYATGIMCSYAGVDGRPSCANGWLREKLPTTLHVTSDCGAFPLFVQNPPAYAPDNLTAAVWALRNGTDLEMGSIFYTTYLPEAVHEGLVSETQHIDSALRRAYLPQFRAGRFDNWGDQEWAQLGWSSVGTHADVQLDTALQGIVLLKNEHSILPLSPKQSIAVLGPLAHTRAGLMSSYESDQTCPGGLHDCVETLAESIRRWHVGGVTTNSKGVDVESNRTDGIGPALTIASEADVIILCLGNTKDQEQEGKDRTTTNLPGLQEDFAMHVFALGIPVVLVFVHGGQIAIDRLVKPSAAIVDVFNPNTIGGTALALSLMGHENRWGKLPYTLYPARAMETFDMEDHSMTAPPGRTYRYFTGTSLFPFGFGLSYTTFTTRCQGNHGLNTITIDCQVENTGARPGDEVLQVYHSAGSHIRELVDHPVPLRSLRAFQRVHVDSAAAVQFQFRIEQALSLVNASGLPVLYPGTHALLVSNGAENLFTLDILVPLSTPLVAE